MTISTQKVHKTALKLPKLTQAKTICISYVGYNVLFHHIRHFFIDDNLCRQYSFELKENF